LIATLIFWVLLALNTDYNYLKIFQDNYAKYFGKSIEQKRAVTYSQEYYDFLVFAKEKLSKEPVKFGTLSSLPFPQLQARIFLIPHVWTSNKTIDYPYLLVYRPSKNQSFDHNKYRLLAKRSDQELIYERIK
jgi:hypothetical protein